MRPARLCRAMAAPTWFGRASSHAAVISCCVLPVARARTRSLRLDELRLPPTALAIAVRERPLGRAEVAALAAAVGVLAGLVFSSLSAFAVADQHTLGCLQFLELSGQLFALRVALPAPEIGNLYSKC